MEPLLDPAEPLAHSPANGKRPPATTASAGGEEDPAMDIEVRMCGGRGEEVAENGRLAAMLWDAVHGSAVGFAAQDGAVGAAPNVELDVDRELVAYAGQVQNNEYANTKDGGSCSGSLLNGYAATCHLQPEREGDFFVSDLVWGKVKSHPWWPGQIFHPSDSSDKAMKYYRKDCYLVAYFGDHTFAWNEASLLKPFREHFSEAQKQSNSESFRTAVDCALEEVSRRVEFGLACPCLPDEVYNKMEFQTVENSGIREESSLIEATDNYSGVDSFQPDELLGYIKTLSKSPSTEFDRLNAVIVKAHLLAFYRLRGYLLLPEFQFHEDIVENDADGSVIGDKRLSTGAEHAVPVSVDDHGLAKSSKAREASCKCKHNLKDIVYHRRKGKSLSELMGESVFCLDSEYESDEKDSSLHISPLSGEKRKAVADPFDDSIIQKRTKTVSLSKVSQAMTASPRQSFKIGECIRRVAIQLSGSSSMPKNNDESSKQQHAGNDFDESLENLEGSTNEDAATLSEISVERSLDELLLTARFPLKGYSFLSTVIRFFSEFRNSVSSTQHRSKESSLMGKVGPGRKRRASAYESQKEFKFYDENDTYWTDMVVEDHSEGKPVPRPHKRKESKPTISDPGRPRRSRMHSRRQQNHEPDAEKPAEPEIKEQQLPAELILSFNEVNDIPSGENLIQMLRHFGPLKESETKVDSQTSRARVVFRRRFDAEVAYSSASVFNIFGSTVNYQLNNGPLLSIKNSSLALTQVLEDAET